MSQQPTMTPERVTEDKEGQQPAKRDRTQGEKAFDGMVYGGINWVVNTVLSAVLSFKVVKSDIGKKAMDSLDRVFAGIRNRPHIPGKPGILADMMINVGTLFTGGTLLLAPIHYLESKKSSIVRWLDTKFANNNKSPEQIAQMHQQMDDIPKQTARSLLEGRFVVLGLGLGLGITAGKQMNQAGEVMGKAVTNTLTSEAKPHWGPFKRQSIHDVSRLLMVDLIIGAFTTMVFYVSSRVFAKRIEQRKEDKHYAREFRAEHGIRAEAAPSALREEPKASEAPGYKVQHIVTSLDRVTSPPAAQSLSA